jgi:hypothetical protein
LKDLLLEAILKGLEKKSDSVITQMTISIVSQKIVPQVNGSVFTDLPEGCGVTLIESHIEYLDELIEKLVNQRNALVDQRYKIVQANQDIAMARIALGKLPISAIAPFLAADDFGRLSTISRHFNASCAPGGKYLVAHLGTPKTMSDKDLLLMLRGLHFGAVETLCIDLKRSTGKKLMNMLSIYGQQFHSLRSLKINASAECGSFITDLYTFMEGLPFHQLKSLYLSGFRSLDTVGRILSGQSLSIENFQVDYYVNGHERDLESHFLPPMPSLRSLVYDVADVTDLPANLLAQRLQQIQDKRALRTLYLPHMQISGSASEIVALIELIKSEFFYLDQLVIRFRKLPLSVKDIIHLRESFSKLPAVCISDHFVVCQSSWCSWWPSLKEVWSGVDMITGVSVFREQIDFESLGTDPVSEWDKLSAEQKAFWSGQIVNQVTNLYLQQS